MSGRRKLLAQWPLGILILGWIVLATVFLLTAECSSTTTDGSLRAKCPIACVSKQ
jgi:hypothetical protein